MPRITKIYLEDKLAALNATLKKNFTLDMENVVNTSIIYLVKDKDKVIFRGVGSDIDSFMEGYKLGYKTRGLENQRFKSEDNEKGTNLDSFPLIYQFCQEYPQFTLRARKDTVDATYGCNLGYIFTVLAIKPANENNVIYFNVRQFKDSSKNRYLCEIGELPSINYEIPKLRVPIIDVDSLDEFFVYILKVFDRELLKNMLKKRTKGKGFSDITQLLWIDKSNESKILKVGNLTSGKMTKAVRVKFNPEEVYK